MSYKTTISHFVYRFDDLKTVLAKATPFRSGDALAGITAGSYEERVAAQIALADIPLRDFLQQVIIPYETDEVTRLIIDTHDARAFAPLVILRLGSSGIGC